MDTVWGMELNYLSNRPKKLSIVLLVGFGIQDTWIYFQLPLVIQELVRIIIQKKLLLPAGQ